MKPDTSISVDTPGIKPGRLGASDYIAHFKEAPLLTDSQAVIDASRCHYCFDAPCSKACPAGIDVPCFVHRIAQHNTIGATEAILSENVLGGICSRVCPTENLCEQACVRNAQEGCSVQIKKLQRFATDDFFARPQAQSFFERKPATGKRVAIVGAGPAGLTAAHSLARQGHEVVIFDARPKPGGLNEYGLAGYKTSNQFTQREIEWLLSIGGIELQQGHILGRDSTLTQLQASFDAVFLALGLAGTNSLALDGEKLSGVRDAVDFIAELRQAEDKSRVAVGRSVVVLGGGMTAVDAAVQAKLLGAREVTLVYRRGEESFKASAHEREWAQTNGVNVRYWSSPKALYGHEGNVVGIRFALVRPQGQALIETGETYRLEADMVLKAIGQCFDAGPLEEKIALTHGRIAVDEHGHTSLSGIWAGGDCCAGGLDLTVDAVRQGKLAAQSIHHALTTSLPPLDKSASAQECTHG